MSKVMVYGYGESGQWSEKLLRSKGYNVTIVDDKKGLHKELAIGVLEDHAFMVVSPGILPSNPLIQIAKRMGMRVISEIELANLYYKGNIIAVTGTNGKTSTVSMITQLLSRAGFSAASAGNEWIPFTQIVVENRKYDYLVLEVSSQQLENTESLKPLISAITTLSPDHMERYKTPEDYYNEKLKIFRNTSTKAHHLINSDLAYLKSRYVNSNAHKLTFSLNKEADISLKDNFIYFKDEKILDTTKLDIAFKQFISNFMIVVGVSKILNIDNKILQEVVYNFPRLEHRVEKFLDNSRGLFLNDSKATNIEATQAVLESFEESPILICGGKDKHLDLESFVSKISSKIDSVLLIGELTDKLYDLFRKKCVEEKIFKCYNLDNAINTLDKILFSKKIVLFSPASASFDQFDSFEHRGKEFKRKIIERFKNV